MHTSSRSPTRRPVLLFLLGVLPAAAGCTAALEEEVERLRDSLGDLRSHQAEQTAALATLQNDLRSLGGKFEELDFTQRRRIGSEVEGLRSAISTLKRRVPPPAVVPSAQLDDDEVLAASLPPETAERFSAALGHVREGAFADAVPLLQSVLDQTNGQPQAANALFWLGVCYDGLSDDRNALLAYNQLVGVYGRHPRAPQAFLRQAAVLERTGDKRAAQITLKKLVADHPRSAEAAAASQKLRQIPSS